MKATANTVTTVPFPNYPTDKDSLQGDFSKDKDVVSKQVMVSRQDMMRVIEEEILFGELSGDDGDEEKDNVSKCAASKDAASKDIVM